jgi:hypothetical protein
MTKFFPMYSVVARKIDDESCLCIACNQEGRFVIYEGRILDGRYTMTPLDVESFQTFDAAKQFTESYECPSPSTSEDEVSKTIEPPKTSSRRRKPS